MSQWTRHDINDTGEEDADYYGVSVRYRKHVGKPPRLKRGEKTRKERERREQGRRRVEISQPFKCRKCKSFIGMPVTGGRQRNHCPSCLHSLHVDLKTPGDRLSDCVSLMEPVATFFRQNGEQALVHRCRGCGIERHNRIAADDNPLLLMRMSLVEPRTGAGQQASEGKAESA